MRKPNSVVAGVEIITPLRELIRLWPDLAKKALHKCINNNLQSSKKSKWEQSNGVTPDDPRFEITFDFRLLDDTLFFNMDEEKVPEEQTGMSNSNPDVESIASVDKSDEKPILVEDSKEGAEEKAMKSITRRMLRKNHPLMIMVNEQKKVLYVSTRTIVCYFDFNQGLIGII